MEEIIRIEGLGFTYPGASAPTLSGVDLTVHKGDFLAIVGNNGCGKSTLCKTLNGLIPHFITGRYEGSVKIGGLDVKDCGIGELAQKVGYVYQDFENQIIRPTVLDDASYACMNYAMRDYIERGREALAQCGLTGREDDFIWQLSGGQSHLLALAGVLALRPDVLILDEPIAQLDPMHADRVYQVLERLNREEGKTIIVIEHHSEYIASYCSRVALMKNGAVKWVLDAREALCRVSELEECNIFPPQATMAAFRCTGREEGLPVTRKESLAFFRPRADRKPMDFRSRKDAGESAVEFRDVTVSYRSVKGEARCVFDSLSLKLGKGEKIALIGSNGAGKSTLMKLMVGLLRPKAGQVIVNGRDIRNVRTEKLGGEVSMVYQNPEDMFIKDSIEKDIAFAMEARGLADWKERTAALLERFRLSELKERDGRLLSGGQMRRASLAIGVALEPGILLLDEPTANLDLATRREIREALSLMDVMADTVMIATHDMQLVCEWAERVIVLSGGRVVADGSRDEVFSSQALLDEVGIRPPEIFTLGRALSPDILAYTIDEFLEQVEVMK